MNFRHIAYFVEAVKYRSLSAVAKRQNVTVQAVSKGINELEREVGTRLLIRGNQGVKPTALGYALYQRSLEAVEGFSQLEKFCAPVCLVTLRGPKPEAYRVLENGIGALIGASGGAVAP